MQIIIIIIIIIIIEKISKKFKNIKICNGKHESQLKLMLAEYGLKVGQEIMLLFIIQEHFGHDPKV